METRSLPSITQAIIQSARTGRKRFSPGVYAFPTVEGLSPIPLVLFGLVRKRGCGSYASAAVEPQKPKPPPAKGGTEAVFLWHGVVVVLWGRRLRMGFMCVSRRGRSHCHHFPNAKWMRVRVRHCLPDSGPSFAFHFNIFPRPTCPHWVALIGNFPFI